MSKIKGREGSRPLVQTKSNINDHWLAGFFNFVHFYSAFFLRKKKNKKIEAHQAFVYFVALLAFVCFFEKNKIEAR